MRGFASRGWARAVRWLVAGMLGPALVLGLPGSAVRAAPSAQPAPAASTATWQALPHGGLNGIVQALAAVGSDLYVGGFFTATADGSVQNLNGIALLHSGQWQALPDQGLNGGVTSLAVIGSDVYAGGTFTGTAAGTLGGQLSYVARLSTGVAPAWHPLAHNGLNWDVRQMAAHNGDLYVGGFFDQSADGVNKDLNAVALYHNGGWVALPNKGMFNFFILHCCFVDAFAFNGNSLVVGGIFTATDDFHVQNLGGLAVLSGGAWSATPNQGLGLDQPFAHDVHSLDYIGNDLYAAGTFTRTTDHTLGNLNGVAVLHNGAWVPVPHDGFRNGSFGAALALAPRGTDLYVGGTFTETADGLVPNINGVARLSGGAWQALPDGGIRSGVGIGVQAITFASDNLYVGGFFTETAGGALQNLGNIALLAVPPLVSYPLDLPLVER
jgi:hypothetical protein